MDTITASEIKASDILNFFGDEYKVRSCLVKSDRVEVVFWDTNDGQPYLYAPDERMIRL